MELFTEVLAVCEHSSFLEKEKKYLCGPDYIYFLQIWSHSFITFKCVCFF